MSSLRNVSSSSSNSKPKSKYSDFDLFNATEKGDVAKVADILENSTLSITDVKNAIHIAAKYDRIEVMKLFIEKNSREVINIIDNDMNTPLIIASFEGHHNMIKLLLNALASVNDQNILGITPLIAVLIPPVNNPKECLVQLLDRKADIHLRNSEGSTALLCSATYSDVDCFKLLLGRGANIKDVNSNGRNSMHLAVLNFSLDLLMYLVSEHSELAGHQDVDGHTPLHICCDIGYAAGLRILLSSDFYKLNKKNLEIKSNYGIENYYLLIIIIIIIIIIITY
jgi:ankyrin repeat protein